MWKIYSKEFGIAIETSYEKLKLSLKSGENVFPTEVAYIDFENNVFDWKSNAMTVYTIKRKEYKSESEFRLIISHPRRLEDELARNTKLDRNQLYNGNPVIHCEIDTNILITKIHVSPYAPKWYNELIKDVLMRYNLKNVEVYQSNL
ncbi:hypothetical protein [Myroides sp. DW712]|uniref:hypothetical protein n=1 Tax=Myroides sp. DW712 TaxID=3389800 RepID=UPI00397D3879